MPGANNPIPLRVTRQAVIHVVRTTIAAVASLLIARLFKLPEAYWAAITTLVVMQSSLGAALTISWQRFVGSAIGAVAGALFATYFGSNTAMFALGIFVMGILCAALRLDKAAYRFAGITLAIIMLTAHTAPAWIVAIHRFIEVAVGIAVGLALTAVWPEDAGAFDAPAR
jgi:uncharacterized membrane protein YgaE (UPF0421/DUF939 family)